MASSLRAFSTAVSAAASTAASSAASSSSAAAPGSLTLSAYVRSLLVSSGNKPYTMKELWELAKAGRPELVRTKTHFKKRILKGMYQREEVRWLAAEGLCAQLQPQHCSNNSSSKQDA